VKADFVWSFLRLSLDEGAFLLPFLAAFLTPLVFLEASFFTWEDLPTQYFLPLCKLGQPFLTWGFQL
jgi:hypothetical protein